MLSLVREVKTYPRPLHEVLAQHLGLWLVEATRQPPHLEPPYVVWGKGGVASTGEGLGRAPAAGVGLCVALRDLPDVPPTLEEQAKGKSRPERGVPEA